MKTLGAGSVAIGAALTLFALTASPAFANGQAHSGGGGGGGGHASFGGHASGGGRSFGGAGGAHFARAPSFRGGGSYGGHAVATTGFARPGVGFSGRPGAGFAGRPGGSRFVGGVGGRFGGPWHGGYWRGGFWPGVFWGGSFAWFLPVLPAFCATYWWNSVPYYYYNDVYYTYDPSASGYVVTTPPPALDSDAASGGGDGAGPAAAPQAIAPGYPNPDAPAAAPMNGDGLFAYPKNGQSDEQQSTDRAECGQWAGAQTGADGSAAGSMDYKRALTACLQGRGYSVD
jgi:hypothetical protein